MLIKKIAKASVITVSVTVINLFLGVIIQSLMGKTFGPEGVGLFASFLMLVQLYSMVAIFGLPTALSKYTAEHEEKKEQHVIVRIFSSLFIFATCSSIVVGIVANYLTPFLMRVLHIQSNVNVSFYSAIAVLFFSYSMLCQALFRGLLKAVESAVIQSLSFLGILIVILYAYFFRKIPVYYAIVFGYLISGILGIYLCKKEGVLRLQFDKKAFLKIVKFAIPVALMAYLFFISQWVDRFTLGVFLGIKEIGIFTAAIVIPQAILRIPLSMTNILIPSYSKISMLGNDKVETAYNLNVKIFSYFFFLMGSITFLFSREIILFLYDESFSGSIVILKILSINLFLSCLNIPAATLIIGSGFPKVSAIISSVSVVIQIILIVVLTARFGIIGTAFGKMFSLPFLIIFNILGVRKLFNIKFDFEKVSRPAIICISSIFIYWISCHYFFNKYISGFFFILVYLLLTFYTGFTNREKEIIKKTIG